MAWQTHWKGATTTIVHTITAPIAKACTPTPRRVDPWRQDDERRRAINDAADPQPRWIPRLSADWLYGGRRGRD